MPAPSEPFASAVVVAAGSSARMAGRGIAGRKPWLEVAGLTLLEHACRALAAAPAVAELVLVVHGDDLARAERLRGASAALERVAAVVPGGAERSDSVRMGAARTAPDARVILVHDAARPLVEPELVDAVARRALADGAALAAVRVRDTLKVAARDGARAERTLDRAGLWAAQTPQGFRAVRFRELLARAEALGFRPTDDAALWERWEGPVALVEGSSANLKVTEPDDLAVAAALLGRRLERERAEAGG